MPFKFHGGVHPNYMKAPDVPVTVIAPPPQVVLPMMQHIGAPCKPLVAVGDYVKMGQKIADNPAPVSAPIHATVSGKVIAIEPRPHPLGDMIPAIVIENDFQDTPCTDLAPLTPEQMKDPEAILERIRPGCQHNVASFCRRRRRQSICYLFYRIFPRLLSPEHRIFFRRFVPGWREIPPICTKCCKVSGNVGFVSIFAGSLIFKLVQFDVFPPFLVDEVRLVC